MRVGGKRISYRTQTSGLLLLIMLGSTIADADPIFADGYEAGQDSSGGFINWDVTAAYGGAGSARAIDDTLIYYRGRHSACFEVTDGTRGGWSYTGKHIRWPAGRKLWYSCYIRNGPSHRSNVTIGGIYFLEAYIVDPSGYRERANIETHPYSGLPDSLFMLRMAYRGRDGERHRQQENLQFVRREVWHRITMLVDLSEAYPLYAWWLNDRLIWTAIDTTQGTDTLAPNEFHAGVCWVDWATGNRALVWIDDCLVADDGPVPILEQNATLPVIPASLFRLNCRLAAEKVIISFGIEHPEIVDLALYNSTGRLVAQPTAASLYPPGTHQMALPVHCLIPGVYFIRLVAGQNVATGKIWLPSVQR